MSVAALTIVSANAAVIASHQHIELNTLNIIGWSLVGICAALFAVGCYLVIRS